MLSFLARMTGSPESRIRIKPDCDYVFLTGYGDDAQGQYLRGKVTLSVAKDESVKGVQLKMVGSMAIGHRKEENTSSWDTEQIFLHQFEPFLISTEPNRTSKHRNTYEWPFEVWIPGNQPETFRGCSLCSISYRLEASTLNGASSNVRAFVPARIIRSPPISSYELMDPVTLHGKWAGKVEFNVSLGHQAIALGGFIPVEAHVAKVEPGVQVTKASFCLREYHTVKGDGTASPHLYERVAKKWEFDVVENGDSEMHSWDECLQLPRIVRLCSPDFDVCGHSVTHTLHFAVALLENGTESEYDTPIPINLFISPDLPVSGWDIFSSASNVAIRENVEMLANGIQVPPEYCKGDDCVSTYTMLPGCPPPAYTEC